MRKLTQFVLITVTTMAAPSTLAEMKIAVLSCQVMLLESDAAKQYAVDVEKKLDPQLSKLKNLKRDAKTLQNKLVSSGSKMSQGDCEKAKLDFKQKVRDFQFQSRELNESKATADRDMLKRLKPKLDQAVKGTIKEDGYDMVVERGAAIDVKP